MIKSIVKIDTQVSRWIFDKQPRGDFDDKVIEQVTRIFGVIPAFIIAALFTKNLILTTVIFGAIVFINFFLVELLIKKIVKRKRPAFREKSLHTYSFPSTHASTMGMIAGHFLVLPNLYNYYPIPFLMFLVYGILVILSRVLYGHHFLLDVLAGFIFGFGIAIPLVMIINSFMGGFISM